MKVIKEPARKTPKINMDFCNTNLGLLQLVEHELKTTLGIEPHFSSQLADQTRKTILASANLQKKEIRKFLSRVPTIKLKAEKVRYVENWPKKKIGRRREGTSRVYFLALANLAATSSS